MNTPLDQTNEELASWFEKEVSHLNYKSCICCERSIRKSKELIFKKDSLHTQALREQEERHRRELKALIEKIINMIADFPVAPKLSANLIRRSTLLKELFKQLKKLEE